MVNPISFNNMDNIFPKNTYRATFNNEYAIRILFINLLFNKSISPALTITYKTKEPIVQDIVSNEYMPISKYIAGYNYTERIVHNCKIIPEQSSIKFNPKNNSIVLIDFLLFLNSIEHNKFENNKILNYPGNCLITEVIARSNDVNILNGLYDIPNEFLALQESQNNLNPKENIINKTNNKNIEKVPHSGDVYIVNGTMLPSTNNIKPEHSLIFVEESENYKGNYDITTIYNANVKNLDIPKQALKEKTIFPPNNIDDAKLKLNELQQLLNNRVKQFLNNDKKNNDKKFIASFIDDDKQIISSEIISANSTKDAFEKAKLKNNSSEILIKTIKENKENIISNNSKKSIFCNKPKRAFNFDINNDNNNSED